MKAVIQRVNEASVSVEGREVSKIQKGILTLLAVMDGDDESQIDKLVQKIVHLRIFPDSDGKMNRSLLDIQGEHLIISQFTIAGDCRKGRRPSFVQAASPEIAKTFYEKAIDRSRSLGVSTQGGEFQADMKVSLVNDGPVTFVLEV